MRESRKKKASSRKAKRKKEVGEHQIKKKRTKGSKEDRRCDCI